MSGGIQAGAAVLSNQVDSLTADDTTTSTTYVVSSLSLTLANRGGGMAHIACDISLRNDNAGRTSDVVIFDDGDTVNGDQEIIEVQSSVPLNRVMSLNGSIVDVRMKTQSAGTIRLRGTATARQSRMSILEIS